jgi:predicted GNAT superfamily acetyltransferase
LRKARRPAGFSVLRALSGGAPTTLARVDEARPAWVLARVAAEAAHVELRPLTSLDQFDEALGIMVATWGGFQLPPREVMTALAHSGNVPLGAYDGEQLLGFVLGWAGVDEGGLHVHSHMLAALPERRHRGVGYALKLGQRAQALDQGIHVARWTFDPLVARNAWLNIGKLGAVADRFGRAFYGEMTDEINRGDRTDRLMVRWDLDPDPAPRTVSDGLPTVLAAEGDPDAPVPVRRSVPAPEGAVIEVPREHLELRQRDAKLASRWRDASADALEACFGAGLVVVAFDRDRSGYVLTPEAPT